MVSEKKICFSREENKDFSSVLRQRVNLYFKEGGLPSKGTLPIYLKSIFLMSFAVLTYIALMLSVGGLPGLFGFYILLGFFISIGTMNISHDALHGAYVSNPIGNRVFGFFMDLFGASSFYWKKEHTVDHHTFTNVAEHDADLDAPFLLRLCPKAKSYSFHRFQHWYAPILYSMNLIRWVHYSDYRRVYRHFTAKPEDGKPKASIWEIVLLLSFKAIHSFLFIALPMLVLPYAWWQVGLAYLGFLATAGLVLTVIFQLAHIVEDVAFPLPNLEGKIENSFVTHQMMTTSNFARRSKVVSFLFGGLNFQVEHHIFPHISHMHLPKIAPIVQETAREFGVPYHENPSFFAALRSHFRTLKRFGQPSA
jgi:linoleoyl-CoA desaturase